MNDLDRFLGSGSDAPVPSDLTAKIQASINGAIDAAPNAEATESSSSSAGADGATGTATSGTGPGILAWAAGIVIVGVLIAVLVPGGGSDPVDPGSQPESVDGGSSGSGGGAERGGPRGGEWDRDATSELANNSAGVSSSEEQASTDPTATLLENGILVRGRVLDESGDGVAHASVVVSARIAGRRTRALERTGEADADGAYAILIEFPGETSNETAASPLMQSWLDAASSPHQVVSPDPSVIGEEYGRRLVELAARAAAEQQMKEVQIALDARVVGGEPARPVGWAVDPVERAVEEEQLRELEIALKMQQAELENTLFAGGFEEGISVRASRHGYQASEAVMVDFPDGPEVEVDVVLLHAEPLEGVLVDRAGVPIVGAEIAAVASLEGRSLPESSVRTTTAPDGTFSLAQLPPGSHLLTARGAGIEPLAAWIETGPEPIEVVAVRAGIIELTVVDATGTPVPGARVEWVRDRVSVAHAMVGKLGEATVERLSPGPVLVRVFTQNHTYPVLEQVVDIAVGAQSLTLVVDEPTDLHGVLRVPEEFRADDGTIPSNGFLIAAYRSGGLLGSSSGSYARVEPDGSFQIAGVPPGDYVLAIARRSPRGSMTIRSFQDVRLRSGRETIHLDYIDAPLAHLDIAVESRDGTPIPGAKIEFVRDRTGGRSDHRTGKDGTFSIDLHHDPLSLVIEASGYTTEVVEVRARAGGTETIRVVLDPRPTVAEAVLRSLRSRGSIVVHEQLSARALLASIELLEPGAIVLDPSLAASEVLDRWTVSGHGPVPLAKLFLELLSRGDIAWELEGARIHLALGKGLDEK